MKYPQFRFTTAAIAATALALTAANSGAETYYWKPGTTQGLWTDISNWSTEAIDGADAAALPSASDSLYGTGDYNFDLGGGDYTLTGWPTPGDWNNHYLTVANGTLAFTGEVSTHSGQINVDANGELNLSGSFVPGLYSGAGMQINVNNGGTMSIIGSIRLYSGSFSIANGGSMTFAPSNLRFGAEAHNYALSFSNSGTLTLPNGFRFDRWDVATVDAGASYTFTQAAGTLNLGGSIENAPASSSSKPGPFSVIFSGGTVNVTEDASFNVTSVDVTGNVTFDVASGKTLNLAPVTVSQSATLSKTGSGYITVSPIAQAVTVAEGGLALSGSTYDLSAITFAADTMVKIAALGAAVDAYDASLLQNATVVADFSGATAGTVIFSSSDATLLEKVRTDLASSVPAGMSLVLENGDLSLETPLDYVLSVSGSVNDPSAWGGSLPPVGAEVAIAGAGVVATLSSGTFPAWSSVEVKNGATLCVETDVSLPPIVLNKNVTLEITNNATATIANITDLSGIATASQVPVISVASGATLIVPGGMKFKNIDFRLYGTITKASDNDAAPVFGYADSGETSYFAMTVDGGVLDFHSSQDRSCGAISIVCPANGGTVVPVDTIVLRNTGRTVNGWDDFGNWEFGVGNPTSVPFDVLVDGTALDCSAFFYASGAAHLSLVNGACIRRNSSCLGHYFSQAIQDSATITVNDGCYIDFTTGDGLFAIDNQAAVDAVKVINGGIYNTTYNSSGWVRGVFVSDGGVLGVSKLYAPSSNIPRSPRSDLLSGFGAARLDGDLEIASLDIGSGNYDWDRHTTMANIPFSGTGDVIVTNGVPAYPFTVTMLSGANTATGTIKVAPVAGTAETTLFFADGANWAGSVVAGNVALTNLTGAAAATTTFGSLNLAEDFPVRVWLDNGSIATNDMINVGEYVANGGKLLPTLVDGGDFPGGAKLTIGLIGKGNTLPAGTLPRKWVASTADAGDGSHDILSIKFGAGTQITLR